MNKLDITVVKEYNKCTEMDFNTEEIRYLKGEYKWI